MKHSVRWSACVLVAASIAAGSPALAAGNSFVKKNLVSDQAGVAPHRDPKLVNAWGIAFAPGNPFWVNDAGTGVSTLYDGKGVKSSLVVTIPRPPGQTAHSNPTGMVYNPTRDFVFGGWAKTFLFDTEDGTISGWYPSDGSNAQLIVNNSKTEAIYKGLALGTASGKHYLYATNFHAGRVETYDSTFKRVFAGKFVDPHLPRGYAPFGIAAIGSSLYVTFAKQDADKEDDVPGAGNGYVDIFDTRGNLLRRLVSRGHLNSPWGIVRAPRGFGPFGGAILVGNFGDGRIDAYSPNGTFLAALKNHAGNPITIDGLWGLTFGGARNAPAGTLYFTAGPHDEAHGLFGSITPG